MLLDDDDDSVMEKDGCMGPACGSGSEYGNPFGRFGVGVELSNNPLPSVTKTGSDVL